jgi:hypothetical protein
MNAFILQSANMELGTSLSSLDFMKNTITEACQMQHQEEVLQPSADDPADPALPFDRHKRPYWLGNAGEPKGVTFFMHQWVRLDLPQAANASAQRTGEIAWFAAGMYSPFASNAALLSASVSAAKRFTLAQISDHAAARHIDIVCAQEIVNTLHASSFTQCALRSANRWHIACMRAFGIAAWHSVS